MLTTEIKVNGTLIGHIYARNIGSVSTIDPSTCQYEYEIYYVGRNMTKTGQISHDRGDGFEGLIWEILKDSVM